MFDTSSIIGGLPTSSSITRRSQSDDQQVYQATVVTKPTPARSITVSGGAKIVTIGDKAWLATDGKTFQSVGSSVVTTMIGAFDPNLMLGVFGGPALTQNATDMGVEQKNGVSAHHFHVDATSLPASQASIPPNAAVDIWVADEGFLVALETSGFSGNQALKIETTNVNDTADTVTAPSTQAMRGLKRVNSHVPVEPAASCGRLYDFGHSSTTSPSSRSAGPPRRRSLAPWPASRPNWSLGAGPSASIRRRPRSILDVPRRARRTGVSSSKSASFELPAERSLGAVLSVLQGKDKRRILNVSTPIEARVARTCRVPGRFGATFNASTGHRMAVTGRYRPRRAPSASIGQAGGA